MLKLSHVKADRTLLCGNGYLVKLFVILMCLGSLVVNTFALDKTIKNWGVETDMLSWRIGKFPKSIYLAGWHGYKHLKFSLGTGYFDLVEKHLPDHFIDDKTFVLNVKCDYFFHKGYKHWWIGPSLLFQSTKLTSEKNYKSKLNYLTIGFSTGYLFSIKDIIYLGPSLQIHTPLGKYSYIIDTDNRYTVPWSFEPGVRIGVYF